MHIKFMKNNCQDASVSCRMPDGYRHIFFSLLSGFLLFLSFPKFGLGIIAWIAFVPFFVALRNVEAVRHAVLLGLITGITAYVGLLYWIIPVIVNYGHLPYYMSAIIMLMLAGYLSLYLSLFAAGIVFLRKKINLLLFAPLLWVCLEYLKSYLFTGFPWENLGYSQYQFYFLIQFADVAGVYGLSFLVMLLNVTIYEIMTERSAKKLAVSFAVVLLWGGIYVYGILRVNHINKIQTNAPGLNVALIQGSIDQSIKWNETYQKETINIYEKLSLRQPNFKEGLIVWPETAVPFDYQDEGELQRRVRDIAVKTKSWFVFGSMSYVMNGKNKDYWNSAYLLSPQGNVQGKYDKVHLVPYGEYVPLRKIFPLYNGCSCRHRRFLDGKKFYPVGNGGQKNRCDDLL